MLDDEDRQPLPRAVAEDPTRFRRKECTSFAECYASLRDTVTVKPFAGEWRGTFFRSADDAIFQPGIDVAVVEALSGVTHPVFWLARFVKPYSDAAELVKRLNGQGERIGAYLDDVVAVPETDVARMESKTNAPAEHLTLSRLERGRDVIRMEYAADGAAILAASVTYDRHWVASVNGSPVPVARGNFNGLAIPLPPGSGMVELTYRSWTEAAFFRARYALLLVAVIGASALSRLALSDRTPDR
jgi:hypothetical protein